MLKFGRFPQTTGFKKVLRIADALCAISSVPSLFSGIPANSCKSAFVVSSKADVVHINAAINVSQVRPPIISRIAVNVINVLFGPISRHVKPCKPVFSIFFAKVANSSVPIRRSMSGPFADMLADNYAPAGFDVRKYSSLGIVVQKFFEAFKIHFATPSSE